MYIFDTDKDDGRVIQCPGCGYFVNYQRRAGHACCQNSFALAKREERRLTRELITWTLRRDMPHMGY